MPMHELFNSGPPPFERQILGDGPGVGDNKSGNEPNLRTLFR